MKTLPPNLEVLLTHEQIAQRVGELGAGISHDFAGEEVVLIGVLKGAAVFLADLARSIAVNATFDFVAVSSYRDGRTTSGEVQLIKGTEIPLADKNVILVEDILDSGLTARFLLDLLAQQRPKTLKIAACLDKPARRRIQIEADYSGFQIADHFVVGYGMDYQERFRNLPEICILSPSYPD